MSSTRFIVLSTQRSGSTWVIDMLNSHSEILAFSELLLENATGRSRWGGSKRMEFWNDYFSTRRANDPDLESDHALPDYLDRVFDHRDGVDAVGFKVMYGQLGAFPRLWRYLVDHEVAVIHLIRSNYLDVFVSRELAHARDLYHLREDRSPGSRQIVIDPCGLPTRLAEHEAEIGRINQMCESEGVPLLQITYERLRDDLVEFDTILRFLSVPGKTRSLQSGLRRINTRGQSEVIKNYADVVDALKGSRFEIFLEQV